MVNCAGIVGPTNMICEDVPTEEFDKVYAGMFIIINTAVMFNLL